MAYTSIAFDDFPGLRLDLDPEGNPGAVDCLNVEFDHAGRLRSRRGYATFSPTVASSYAIGLTPYAAFAAGTSTQYIVAYWSDSSGTFRQYDLSGTQVSSQVSAGGNVSMVQVGTATTARLYASAGPTAGAYVLRRLDGTTWTAPAGFPGYRYLAVTPWDNRLVGAFEHTNPYRVGFSDPGAPETWGANNFIDLNPGDGEPIIGLATWRDMLFVFKASQFYVFYGTDTGPDGNPIFRYRTIRAGVGPQSASAFCVGHDGIYIFDGTELWRTTGTEPAKFGGEIAPYLRREVLLLNGGTALSAADIANIKLGYASQRLYVLVPATQGSSQLRPLVYDFRYGQWSLWNIDTLDVLGFDLPAYVSGFSFNDTVFFSQRTGTTQIMQMRSTDTTDNATAISWHYQSGFYDLDSPGATTYTRWTRLWGTGSPTMDVFVDHATSDPLSRGGIVTLGTNPAVAHGYHQKAYSGRLFSHKLSGTSAAAVNRLQHDISFVRP